MAEEVIRFFQYLAGERKGEVLPMSGITEEDGMVFIELQDGSRCNQELILPLNDTNYNSQFMAEVSGPDNVWRFDEKWVGRQEEKKAENADGEMVVVQPFIEGRKQITPIPPQKAHSKFGRITKHVETPAPTPKQPEVPSYKSDPVYLMLDKSKKFDTEVTIDLLMSLPKKSLYEVIDDSFEDGGKKMVEFIVKELDVEKIKEAIQVSLEANYNGNVEATPALPKEVDIYPEQPKVNPIASFEPEVVEEAEIGEPVAGEIIDLDEEYSFDPEENNPQ